MTVTLNGYVVGDNDAWLYDFFRIPAFSPSSVRNAIETNPEGEDLIFEINSPGGSVFAGFEMYSLLRGAPCATVAQVQSLAASAASTVMCGCQVVMISPVAQVMLHLPSTQTEGNRDDHRASIRTLDSITQSILNGYELKCAGKTSRHRLEQLMQQESWITAQEAVDLGLADAILWQDDQTVLPQNIVNSVGGGIRSLVNASSGMPAASELLAKYQQLVKDGTAPVDGHPVELNDGAPVNTSDNWRLKARLDIEKQKFFMEDLT